MPFIDLDGDGLDDETGLTASEYARFGPDGGGETGRGSGSIGLPGAGGGAGTMLDDGTIDRDGDGVGDYFIDGYGGEVSLRPGETRRDAQERMVRERRDAGDAGYYGWVDPRYDGTGPSGRASDFDEASANIPLWGGASGAKARVDEARRQREQWERQRWIDRAQEFAPSADDLAVQYGEEGYIGAPGSSQLAGASADPMAIEAERRALEELERIYSSGGLTASDRARLQQGEREMGRAMRAQREADESMLRSRGMGTSGAMVASMLGAQQSGADLMADREAGIQARAEQRALDALAGASSTAGRMRSQSFSEDATRRGAADDWNRWNTDYMRGREQRNTQWRNASQESRSRARQQKYENEYRLAQLRTGQIPGTKDPRETRDESEGSTLGFLGGLLSSL